MESVLLWSPSIRLFQRDNCAKMTLSSKNLQKPSNNHNPIAFDELVNESINKPARYLGHELGVQEYDWGTARVRWALTYPEIYEVGISNSGHIILYSILNSIPGQICDRAYLPAPDLTHRLRQLSQPLFAIESRRPLFTFDILGFSLSYELGATNILEMLDLAKIPLYAKTRGDLPLDNPDAPPLVFAGGPTATSNPEPYADFFDFFVLGDGEEVLPEIGLVIAESKAAGLSRSESLLDLSEIPGIYVPSLYKIEKNHVSIYPKENSIHKRITRRVAHPIPYYAIGLVPNIETIHDRLTIEIRRGCTRGCRFCQPGMLTRPARDVDPEAVINAVETGMRKTGYSDFSLLSLSCSDYLALPAVGMEIKNRLNSENVSLQLPSQRVDRFDDNIAHILGGSRKSGLTFAPEAGTQRLRDIINKGLTDTELLQGIRNAMNNGYRKIKLYFMIGLPGETDEDVVGIASSCKRLQEECKDLGRLKLNITISNFTPKPHTPFQWHSVSQAVLERRQQLLKEHFRYLKGIKGNFTDIRISQMEDFIGRGDRRLSKVIESAWKQGAGMDAWFECLDRAFEAWSKAISQAGLTGKYRSHELGSWSEIQDISSSHLKELCKQPLPWDHIDTGIQKEWLAKDLQKALEQLVVPDCSFETCSKCGVCGPDLGHNKIVEPRKIPPKKSQDSSPSKKISRIRFRFAKTKPLNLLSHLDLLRLLERALRRSQLPVSFSEGFHPLPRMQIALALPLGVEAFGEWMEIDFFKNLEAEEAQKTLQKHLPKGLKLISSEIKATSRSKLSQEVISSCWSFSVKVVSNKVLTKYEWEKAINSLLISSELIWNDTDKKGRPRKRNYRPELKSLQIRNEENSIKDLKGLKEIRIHLDTYVDPLGRSIKPIHVKYWLEKYLGHSLTISRMQRDEIHLLQC